MDWSIDLDAREARHRSGLVLRFEPEDDGGFSGRAVAGLDGVDPNDAPRLAREGGEAFMEAAQTRRRTTLITVGRALFGDRWQRELARAIAYDDRMIRHHVAGARAIKPRLIAELRDLVARRRAEADAAAEALDRTI